GRIPRARASAVHDEAAVDAERLPRHVAGAIGGEKSDDGGDVLGPLHAPERHRLGAPTRELLRGDAHHRALIARDLGPHVRLDEARAHAVDADPVLGVRQRQALGHADHGRLAHVVGQVVRAADLARHRREVDGGAADALAAAGDDGDPARELGALVTHGPGVYNVVPYAPMDCCAHEGPARGDARFDIKKVADGVHVAVAAPAYKVNSNTAIIESDDG